MTTTNATTLDLGIDVDSQRVEELEDQGHEYMVSDAVFVPQSEQLSPSRLYLAGDNTESSHCLYERYGMRTIEFVLNDYRI
eukprot:SAG31_NODE_39125_length_290_cov_1.628272_1_plen_80_part_01